MPNLVRIELFCWVEGSAAFALHVRCDASCGVGEGKPSQWRGDNLCNKRVATSLVSLPTDGVTRRMKRVTHNRIFQLKHLCSIQVLNL